MSIAEYAEAIRQKYGTGQAREHAYRPILESLMHSFEDVDAVNEPPKSKFGSPDFVFQKKSHKDIILGYAEAKDIDKDLNKVEKSEQLHRYSGYENLFLTNYLEFRFYQNGNKYQSIEIGKFTNGEVILYPERFQLLQDELANFLALPPESIKNGKRLAQIMGAKGRRIRNNTIELLRGEIVEKNNELERIYKMMQTLLVHDLSPEKFADMYAQTLVYGLFVARYSDKTPESFTRQEARDLVPKSNPFLQKFFDHIVGPDFVTSLGYIVDELCEVFSVSNVAEIVHKHLKILEDTGEKDPIIHFYEDFLKEYDPDERKKMGAYYTPIPIVQFIVRQVDLILREDFGIAKGLADSEKKSVGTYKHSTKETLHRVQILDPAVGTATFLNETIKHIYQEFEGQEGRWESYVEEDLLPRLHGFELMMAPYTIAHLKLGMTLQETGVRDLSQRLGVYLTNTLEEGWKNQSDIFSALGLTAAVAEEANAAAKIKHERPIMVIIGNPPYSGVSSNETDFANSLIAKYKVEPGGVQKLQERKHWLNDDYVKFIAFAEDMVAKNSEGIVGMITNNGYLDNPTFRGMRWQLAKTFDKIYIFDLHGNAKKKEKAYDGSKDENVFDIMQGVGIILGVKTSRKKNNKLANVYHAEVYGTRRHKFKKLEDQINWTKLTLDPKSLYFVPKNFAGEEQYRKGISLDRLFLKNVTGIVTMGDKFIIDGDKEVIKERVQKLAYGEYTAAELNQQFGLGKNYAKFVLDNQKDLNYSDSKLIPISYRPFDTRWTYFDNKVLWRWRENIMRNLIDHNNLSMNMVRQYKTGNSYQHILVSNNSIESSYVSGRTSEIGYSFPLYLYGNDDYARPNFNPDVLKEFTKNLADKHTPEDVFDYIYATLHSPKYRKKYNEFLKLDFPRIPIPTTTEFDHLAQLGHKLCELHLFKSSNLNDLETTFPKSGSDIIEDVKYWPESTKTFWEDDPEPILHNAHTVTINKQQYFGNVPQHAWNFSIGGYQPAQKWLKDRKGRKLTSNDIVHYQKIIKVLTETDRIMQEIDKVWTP